MHSTSTNLKYFTLLLAIMITQSLLRELESALLRSYARTSQKVVPMEKREQNFISTANYQEEFIKAFMEHAREKRAVIELEIQKGGYIHYPQLAETVYRTVEDKIRRELTTNSLNRKGIDQATFSKLVQKIKYDIQPIFFQPTNLR